MAIKKIPITKARINLGAIVERIRTKGEYVILEKGGIPVAALVDPELLEDVLDSIEIMRAREHTKSDTLIPWEKIRAKYV